MNISLDALRVAPFITAAAIEQICKAAYRGAASQGVILPFNDTVFVEATMYAVRHETGDLATGSGFPTNVGNVSGFAGLLQNGVDVLIEGNASTKDTIYRKRRPCMWSVFPAGIHKMYTKKHRKDAIEFHKSLSRAPRNVIGTASDVLVSVVSFMDTMKWAYEVFGKTMARAPTMVEVYAFHLHGYPIMTDYYLLKTGRKPFTKGATFNATVAKINKQLQGQSLAAQLALKNIGTS